MLDERLVFELPGARAAFTTRHGGVSSGPYRSLNLGRLTDDDPAAVRGESGPAGRHGRGAAGDDPAGTRRRGSRHRRAAGPRRAAVRGRRSGDRVEGARADRAGGRLPADRGGRRRGRGDPARRLAGAGAAGSSTGACGRCASSGERTARGRDRPGRRPVLLRGGGGGARAVRRLWAGGPERRNLDLKAIAAAAAGAGRCRERPRRRDLHDLRRGLSSPTGATVGSRAARRGSFG